jgi:ComF family protein
LSVKKQRFRGFNQAEIVADMVSKAYGIPCQNSILNRQKDTTAQHRLNKEERLKNMSGAFSVIPEISNCSFLLVDDICTTGATLTEAASSLYRAGASRVEAFTLSKRL